MILIKIFNQVLEDFKICKMIENRELNKEEKEYILKHQIKIICVGKIKEKYYRPTIIMTRGNTIPKGSGRSTHLYDN